VLPYGHCSPRPVTARVVATASLLREGFASAPWSAGLSAVSRDGEPVITLCGVEQRPVGISVDVAVGERLVTSTVQGVPDLDAYLSVPSLLREFDELAEGQAREPSHDATTRMARQP
jgi:hypothetical protein